MKIGLWNIDHPVAYPDSERSSRRFQEIKAYLLRQQCDLAIITEANAALQMQGYSACFSQESPFASKKRPAHPPNRYHQVGIYSSIPLKPHHIVEPINGLLCQAALKTGSLFIYGNVITIKDRIYNVTTKKYNDRFEEQLQAIAKLVGRRFIVAGDFNLKLGWTAKKNYHQRLSQFVDAHGLVWPTRSRTDTVQHVIHSADLNTQITLDASVKHGEKKSLSDHPFLCIEIETLPVQ